MWASQYLGATSCWFAGFFSRAPLLAPAALFYVFLAYSIWVVHGLRGLVTGREPQRDKPVRYAHVVG